MNSFKYITTRLFTPSNKIIFYDTRFSGMISVQFFRSSMFSLLVCSLMFNHLALAQTGVAPTAAIVASRISGVAPLAVHFDGSGSSDPSTSRPFHDLQYTWDFDDPTSGTWSTTGKSKNSAFSPETGHLYLTPRATPYNARLTVTNAAGLSSSQIIAITVLDPAQVYAGANTYCFANASLETADWSGCPVDARREGGISTVESALATRFASGKRYLFRRGDSFAISGFGASSSAQATAGPITIGAFGSGNRPVFQGSVGPRTGGASGTPDGVHLLTVASDWRVMDIRFTSNGGGTPINVRDRRDIADAQNSTIYNVTIDNMFNCISSDDTNTAPFPGSFTSGAAFIDIDCSLSPANTPGDGYAFGIISGDKFMFMGVTLHGNGLVIRPWRSIHTRKLVFQNNRIETTDSLQFTVRACSSFNAPTRCPNGTVVPTEHNVFSDNIFEVRGKNSNWFIFCNHHECTVAGNPADDRGNPTRNHIFERNFFYISANPPAANNSNGNNNRIFNFQGSDVTIRNNIFELTGMVSESIFNISLPGGGEPQSEPISYVNHQVYNNTIVWNSQGSSDLTICGSTAAQAGSRCQNNLVYTNAPNPSSQITVSTWSGAIVSGNLRAGVEYNGNPFNLPYPGQGAGNVSAFHLNASSPALNTGTTIPSIRMLDYSATGRSGVWDVGAFEGSGGVTDVTAPAAPSALRIR